MRHARTWLNELGRLCEPVLFLHHAAIRGFITNRMYPHVTASGMGTRICFLNEITFPSPDIGYKYNFAITKETAKFIGIW